MGESIEQLLDVIERPAAWRQLQSWYHPTGPVCQVCGSAITGAKAVAAWKDLRRVYCASCGHTFRPTAGTPIHETSWSPEEFVKLLFLDRSGTSRTETARILGKSAASVRDMLDRAALLPAVVRQTTTEMPTDRDIKGRRAAGEGAPVVAGMES